MHAGTTLRQRLPLDISVVQLRRVQTGVWLVVLLLSVGMLLVSGRNQWRELVEFSDLSPSDAQQMRANLATLGLTSRSLGVLTLIGSLGQWTALVVISGMLVRKRREADWFALYIAVTMVAGIGAIYPPSLSDMVDGQPFWIMVGKLLTAVWITSLFLLPLLFPTGGFVPRAMIVPAAVLMAQALAFVVRPVGDAGSGMSHTVEIVFDLLILAGAIGSLIYRFRRRADAVQRQQMKWGAIGAAVSLPAFLLADAAMRSIDSSFRGVVSLLVFTALAPVFALAFPVCLTIAILRYRLWDIDVIVSRTLVWVLMTALVIAAYVGLVFGIGSLLESEHSTVLSLAAIGLTAVLFQPVRARVQQGVNRLLFGERDDPYRVVRKLAGDLSETVQPVEALRATVRTLTEALRLPYAAITLVPGSLPVAAAGVPGAIEIPIPLSYQSQPVGELIVSPRGGAREFDGADRRLLDELAQQIGVVAHNVRLTNDLQASRERIVTAREEERRRLRRDLHDGLGAQLAALTLQTGALKTMIRNDPEGALTQATELQQELRGAVADIRRLVQGLRPAALDDLGLIGALSARVSTVNLGEGATSDHQLFVTVDAPEALGTLPAAVEVAIYRIVDEALTNVVRHAHADRCLIAIAPAPNAIVLTIEDDGRGIAADRISGVGLQSMQERALELGGSFKVEPVAPTGTRIVAELAVTSDRS